MEGLSYLRNLDRELTSESSYRPSGSVGVNVPLGILDNSLRSNPFNHDRYPPLTPPSPIPHLRESASKCSPRVRKAGGHIGRFRYVGIRHRDCGCDHYRCPGILGCGLRVEPNSEFACRRQKRPVAHAPRIRPTDSVWPQQSSFASSDMLHQNIIRYSKFTPNWNPFDCVSPHGVGSNRRTFRIDNLLQLLEILAVLLGLSASAYSSPMPSTVIGLSAQEGTRPSAQRKAPSAGKRTGQVLQSWKMAAP